MLITKNQLLEKKYLIKKLLFAYILSFAFQALIPNYRWQLPECIFGILISCCLLFKVNFLPKKITPIDFFLLIFIALITVDNLIIHSKNSISQCLIQAYLLGVFLLFRYFFILWKQEMIVLVSKAFICMGVLASLCGIIGFIINYTGGDTKLVDVYYGFPYLGNTIRAVGFTSSPDMLIELIGLAFAFLFSHILTTKKIRATYIIALVVLSLGALLTFSKEIVLTVLVLSLLIWLHLRPKKGIKISIVFTALICAIVYVFFTHIIVLSSNQKNKLAELSQSEFSAGKIIYENKKFTLVESSYLALKKISYKTGKENYLLGVGSGNYAKKLAEAKQTGNYAPNLPIYDPHSTYLGVFAENGIVVLIALLLMICAWIYWLFKDANNFVFYGASAILVLLLVCWLNALSCDILNYRHLWVLLGIASGIFASKEVVIKSEVK
jgi:hypothetical protein